MTGSSGGGGGKGRPSGSRLHRAARLAALPAAHVGRSAVGLGKRVGGRPAEAVAAQVQQRTAEQLFATLGELKGGAMKFGQALSAMEAALPEALAGPYREALVRLQEAAPAMPTAMVHGQLDASFPAGWRRLFREFDDSPAAAASVGEVHRAVMADGTRAAVKIQYPGGADALAADIGLLDRLVPVLRAAVPGMDARRLFAELRDRLADEVDYVREADAQTAFVDAYDGDPDICVPDVLGVEDRVLITRWIDGTPLSKVIADGTGQQRDRAGLLLVRLLLSSPARAGRLHGDPHPGNFRLLPDGRLAVLDFGSTEAMSAGWPARLGPLLAAGRTAITPLCTASPVTLGCWIRARSRQTRCWSCWSRTSSRCARRSTGSGAHGCRTRPGGRPIPAASRPGPRAGCASHPGTCSSSASPPASPASCARSVRPWPSTPKSVLTSRDTRDGRAPRLHRAPGRRPTTGG